MSPPGPVEYVQVAARMPPPPLGPNSVTFLLPGLALRAGCEVTSDDWLVLPW